MKTNIFNITALVLLISTSFIAGNKSLNTDRLSFNSESVTETIDMNSNCYNMVEAKVVNGEVIPVVTLPELTITAEYNDQTMVSAQIVDGEVIPVVQLPVLDIVAN